MFDYEGSEKQSCDHVMLGKNEKIFAKSFYQTEVKYEIVWFAF